MESKDIKVLEELAGNGDVGALCKLGELYLTGNGGVGVDLNKARGLFEAASAKGSNGANYNLGKLYYCGDGVEKDYNKANEYKVSILNRPIYSNQEAGLEEFYSLTDFEKVTKDYVGALQNKVLTEYKSLYGEEK